ncbi:serine/threonine-protein kinase [Actinoplanes sp. M2I2]|uniref:serine/threonine-protein kinase n=1 Tax=Actinoplanes sp. M2I2 TaxID=1734444 RepID=UPI002020CB2C|nr:serine/threonine-protein kinase [Actinoplanes sp. M2I2]
MEIGYLAGGRYRLRERLGHGGMSVVWRATDEVLGRDVAVKVLAPQLADDPAVLRRLRDEARAAAALRHPNIVAVYDYGEDALPYVVMELVDGRTLADLIRGGALPWRTAVAIGSQVAAALAAAHAQGVVHCDVKPANVMVTGTGVKLVDFGIAAAVGAVEDPAAEVLGTPAYLAPERIAGGPIVAATDVYAVGLLLHLTLAGRRPWKASTVTQMLRAHVYAEPDPLPPIAGLPAAVSRLVRRCLSKQPSDRPGAAEVADRLGRIAGLPPAPVLNVAGRAGSGLSSSVAGLTTAPIASARQLITSLPVRRRRAVVGAVAAAGLLAGGLGVRAAGADEPAAPAAAVAATPPPSATTAVTKATAAAQPQTCTVRYALRGTAAGRASAKVTILNTGEVAVPAWRLSFALPSDQRLLKGWSATWRQKGRTVEAAGGRLPAGGTAATSFSTTYGEVAALPVTFRLNGTTCQAEMSVRTAPVANPARPAGAAPQPEPPKTKDKDKAKDEPKPKQDGGDEDEGDEDEHDEEE